MSHSQPTKHHNSVLLILLICCLALLITIFGIAALQFSTSRTALPSQPVLSDDDQEEPVAEEPEDQTHFNGTGLLPTFDAPAGWHIYAMSSVFDGSYVYIDDEPIMVRGESEGPNLKVMMRAFKNTDEVKEEAAWQEDVEAQDTYFYSLVESMKNSDQFENLDWEFIDVTDEYACGNIVGSYSDDPGNIWPNTPLWIDICESKNYVVRTYYGNYDEQPPIQLQNIGYDSITQW